MEPQFLIRDLKVLLKMHWINKIFKEDFHENFTYVGIGIVITSFISIFINKKIINVIFAIVNIIAGISVHLVPNKIIKISIGTGQDGIPRFMGYCMKDTMKCISNHTFTIVSILGISISIISIVYLIYILIKREN